MITKIRIRIVRDNYKGFEVQHRRWWMPFWIQTRGVNTHASVEAAEEWARVQLGAPVKQFSI